MTQHDPLPPPRSPWTGSQHRTRHRWQLDGATSLAEAARTLEDLAAELKAAHHAGWWLIEPMRSGHLVAARASRRQRAHRALAHPAPARPERIVDRAPAVADWRVRVIDEPGVPGLPVFDRSAAPLTAVLTWSGICFDQVTGPQLTPEVLAGLARQVRGSGLPELKSWGVALARVGSNVDLVAHGTGLRIHAVHDSVLVRTEEALTFQHAADGTENLLQTAAAYERLGRTANAMATVGGRLTSADDGFLHISYVPAAA